MTSHNENENSEHTKIVNVTPEKSQSCPLAEAPSSINKDSFPIAKVALGGSIIAAGIGLGLLGVIVCAGIGALVASNVNSTGGTDE